MGLGEAINLAAPEFAVPSEPPVVCGLIYDGKRHLLSGPPEAAKSLITYIIALEACRARRAVCFIDFENGPTETRRMLTDIGATENELRDFLYYEPEGPPEGNEMLGAIVEEGIEFAIIDAAIGAYDASDLDDQSRKDAERFAGMWVKPLWQNGVATIVLDHVVKKESNRGSYAIGSERKAGGVDIHIGCHAIKKLHRGSTGLIRLDTHKDRPAWLDRPHPAELELVSDPVTHAISWTFRPASATASETGDGWKPTVLMQRVSEYVAAHPGATRNAIEKDVRGKSNEHKRQAIDELVTLGHITEGRGKRNARVYVSVSPYTSPDLAPPSPGEDATDLAQFAPRLQGEAKANSAGEDGEDDDQAKSNGASQVDQDEVERLAALHAEIAKGGGGAPAAPTETRPSGAEA